MAPVPGPGRAANPVPFSSPSALVPWTAQFPPTPVGPRSPLPVELARYGRPQLEGEVEDIRETTVVLPQGLMSKFKGPISLLLLPFKPTMVLGAWLFRGNTPKERATDVVVSVLRGDGTVLQARLEGELCGAVPRLGDYVSMWGSERHGVLIMGLGFNHSVNAEIRIQKR